MSKRQIYLLCLALLLCFPERSIAQISYQYWIDNDTGSTVSGTATASGDINLNIDVAGLSPGIHFYNVRAKQGTDWGTVYRSVFFIPRETDAATSSLQGYECWVDNDYKNRTSGSMMGSTSSPTLNIDVNSLTPGVHFLSIRAQDTNNVWGDIHRTLFYIPRETDIAENELKGYEYWIDNDYDNRTTTEESGSTLSPSLNIDVSSLLPGVHFLNMRVQDASGVWGTVQRYLFVIAHDRQETASGLIARYRYDFGGEPTEVEITPTSEYTLNQQIEVPEPPLPTIIDDECHFSFNGGKVTLMRNVEMNFSLSFMDETGMSCSPLGTTFIYTATRNSDIETLEPEGTITISEHSTGGYTVAQFTIDATAEYKLQASASCEMRLYSSYGALLSTVNAETMLSGYYREYEPATYYIVLFNNQQETRLTLGGFAAPEKEAYAVLTAEGSLLTFYFDEEKASRNGMDIGPFDKSHQPDWLKSSSTLKDVIFHESFADFRPTSTAYWFYGCYELSAITGLDNLKTNKVTSMENMFCECVALTSLDLTGFNTEKVTSMEGMFNTCSSLSVLNLSSFNTASLTNTSSMFKSCSQLTTIYVSEDWDMSGVTSSNRMFLSDNNLVGGMGTSYQGSYTDAGYARIDGGDNSPGYLTLIGQTPQGPVSKICAYAVFDSTSGTLTFKYGEKPDGDNVYEVGNTLFFSANSIPWDNSKLWNVIFDASFAEVRPKYSAYWFYNASSLRSLKGMEYFNTSEVTDMNRMFYGCTALKSLDLRYFNTGNVINMSYMFYDCKSLTSLNLSSFNTSKVNTMACMFFGCNAITTLDLSSFNTSNVTCLNYFLADCFNLTNVNLRSFNTNKVTSMRYMFSCCRSLTSLDLSSFNTHLVTNFDYMFLDCAKLPHLDVSHFDTGNAMSLGAMFARCSMLTSLDVTNFDTRNVRLFYAMFYDCASLTSIDLSNFDTSKATSMRYMFSGCHSMKTFDLQVFKTSNVTNMEAMFQHCKSLTSLSLKNFDTSNVTTMMAMFNNCNQLKTIDVSSFNTGNVTNMSEMFELCNALQSLDLNHFNTQKVTNMERMFYLCNALTSLKIDNFNTSKVKNMKYMFADCNNLTSLDLSNFDTGNVTDMDSMFCSRQSAHLKTWYLIILGSISHTFTWNTTASKLKTIYVSDLWKTDQVTTGMKMFTGCTTLMGEKGTAYQLMNDGLTYARIDGGTVSPGYFTYKASVQRKKGDVNGDGDVDIADAVCIVNHIVGKPNTTFIEAAADANGDGDIDIADAVHIVNLVVGKITSLTPKFDFTLPEPQ